MTTIGQNSPGDAGPEHRRAERRRQQARVGEHRDERPERGRAERDAEQPALGVETAACSDEADDDADRERDRPPGRAPDERAASHVVLHELEAGEEEQEDEAEVREEVDVVVDLRDVEPFRADQDPEHDLDAPPWAGRGGCGACDRIAPALAAASTRTSEPTSAVVSTASGTSAFTQRS